MPDHIIPEPLPLDATVEDKVRKLLVDYFAPIYRERTTGYVDLLLVTEYYADRYLYLRSVVGADIFSPCSRVLVSGFGVGSEMIVARQFDFGAIYGVEVEDIWVTASNIRLQYLSHMYPSPYDGSNLPFADGQFSVVTSGHVIEHTADPGLYLYESIRVLTPGGYLSLEFPNRYHHTELHTQLPSLEWLPTGMRNRAIRIVSSKLSPLKHDVKSRYRSIVGTDLQQIGMSGVKRWLRNSGYPFTILDVTKPAPGVIRCVIRKDGERY